MKYSISLDMEGFLLKRQYSKPGTEIDFDGNVKKRNSVYLLCFV